MVAMGESRPVGPSAILEALAGVAQWQSKSLPSSRREFDSPRPLRAAVVVEPGDILAGGTRVTAAAKGAPVRRLTAVAIVTVAILLVGASAANSAWPRRNGLIAFSRNGNIWLTQPNGQDQHRIAVNGIEPSWSPDGKWIAFTRDASIWMMRADGSDQIQLTGAAANENAPSWSPNGKYVLF